MFLVTRTVKNAVSILANWNLESTAIWDAKRRGNGAVVQEVKVCGDHSRQRNSQLRDGGIMVIKDFENVTRYDLESGDHLVGNMVQHREGSWVDYDAYWELLEKYKSLAQSVKDLAGDNK